MVNPFPSRLACSAYPTCQECSQIDALRDCATERHCPAKPLIPPPGNNWILLWSPRFDSHPGGCLAPPGLSSGQSASLCSVVAGRNLLCGRKGIRRAIWANNPPFAKCDFLAAARQIFCPSEIMARKLPSIVSIAAIWASTCRLESAWLGVSKTISNGRGLWVGGAPRIPV